MSKSHPIRYVDTPAELVTLCNQLAGSPWLALDTEFLREKTYYPKFCLLQIANETTAACVDPILLENLDPLIDLIYDPAIIKVFHAGRQDLEIFYHWLGRLPAPVFDTQIAAPLLGLPEQISYAGLVNEFTGINLNKAHTRTDWSQRPLSAEQLRYASDDVIYLAKLYPLMRQKLLDLGREGWLDDDFNALVDPELYTIEPRDAWRRLRAANRLKGSQLAILQALARWREELAQTEDRPRNWLLKDEVLLDMARLQPANTEDLTPIRGFARQLGKRYGSELCQLIAAAKVQPCLEAPITAPHKTPNQEALLDLLSAVVRLRAAEQSLNPTILASKKDLEQLIMDEDNARITQGWRKHMVGEELEALLRGEKHLIIVDGEVQVRSS